MVVELLAPSTVWIQWIHATQGAVGLEHILSKAAIKEFCLIEYINVEINVEINLFLSTSMFNRIRARPTATMVAKAASTAVSGSP